MVLTESLCDAVMASQRWAGPNRLYRYNDCQMLFSLLIQFALLISLAVNLQERPVKCYSPRIWFAGATHQA
jgi:hypothetical protein